MSGLGVFRRPCGTPMQYWTGAAGDDCAADEVLMGLRDLFRGDSVPRQSSNLPRPTTGRADAQPSMARAPGRSPITSTRGSARWVPAGEAVEVDGRLIAGGMLYVGTKASALNGRGVEPALIDPTLPVRWDDPDWAGRNMDYWPAYDRIDPPARAAYLSWLADGRRNTSTYIGYVFLFFYGLERRLVDSIEAKNHDELGVLETEIRRLRELYAENSSFERYSRDALEFIDGIKAIVGEVEPPKWEREYRGWKVPTSILVGVGRYVADAKPVPSNWALSFLRHHPEAYLRTPATRCQTEFDELFTIRYRERFGDGLEVRRPASHVSLSYRAASAGIAGQVEVGIQTIPDVSTSTSLIDKLKDLGAECTDELDAYSRFVGRRPDEAESAAAVALLPDELLASHGGAVVDSLQRWTAELFRERAVVTVSLEELVEQWSPGRTEKIGKRDAVAVAALLGKLGVGVEPDVRFGSATPKPGTDVVLFPVPAGAPSAPSASYSAAMSLVHLTAVVAASDGSISEHEQRHLAEHAEHVLGLDAVECQRLEAHLTFLATGKLGMGGVRKRVEGLPLSQRAALGRFLVDVAAADGVVTPQEISTLTKLFAQLGLEESDVYSQVHAVGTGDTGPVTVKDAETSVRWAIERAPETRDGPADSGGGVQLDPAKVQERLAETAHVTALLAGIFTDDDDTVLPPPAFGTAVDLPPPGSTQTTVEPSGGNASPLAGLDAAHTAFVRGLLERTVWTRADAEELAGSCGLPFLDGALDVINEAAIDACGEPLAEGDDTVELNAYAIEEML